MNRVEEILQTSELPTRSFVQVTIGQVFSKMQWNMSGSVTTSR